MLGDIIGAQGIAALERRLAQYGADFVVANGENAADGFGLTETDAKRIFAAGVDVITSGNHIWEKRDFWPFKDAEERLLRPANYPPPSPGHGSIRLEKSGVSFLVVNLQGRDSLSLVDCPFRAFDAIFEQLEPPLPVILVDFHAESTREKEAFGFYLDGRAAAVAGTHTHIQTADEKILPKGSAYITDLGMTGTRRSIIGMDIAVCMERSVKQVAYPMRCAEGEALIQGVRLKIDRKSGKTLSIERI
jgi:metallophosphoesterase (TIGR00282 family)